MIGPLRRFLASRLNVDPERIKRATNEPVPVHMKRWWFALGGTPAYLFTVQIVTGILLAFHYQASPEAAYESVRYITEEASFGWYIRSVHKWSATFMVAAIVLHQMRVYFTGAYQKPREINWMVGMCLLVCTVLTGFTGYSLVYEQLSYWGATVGANISDSVPFVGTVLKQLLLGGDVYNEHTLSRFYVLHAAILPATMILLIFVHIAIIRLQGISTLRFENEPAGAPKTYDFFPDHFYTELVVALSLMILLSALATVFPAAMGPEADPLTTPEVIKPEWYFYVAFRWLKLFAGTAAVLSMGAVLFLMFLWPFVDRWLRRRTGVNEISVWIGIVAVAAILGLMIWEAAVAH